MENLIAAGTLVAAVTLVYLFCFRPMRRHRCAMSPHWKTDANRTQITAMRTEVAMLRSQAGDAPADHPLADHAS